LARRFEQHKLGLVHTTSRLGQPLELVASVEVPTEAEARMLERALKAKKNPRLALFMLQQM
jgi:predicted GIY-YIG superfamily endonuclease